MTPAVALLAGILTAVIPLGASLSLIHARHVDRRTELAQLMLVMALSVLLLLAGPWVWLTYWMRPAAAAVLAFAVVRSARRLRDGTPTIRVSGAATLLMTIAASGLVVLDVSAVKGGFPSDDIIGTRVSVARPDLRRLAGWSFCGHQPIPLFQHGRPPVVGHRCHWRPRYPGPRTPLLSSLGLSCVRRSSEKPVHGRDRRCHRWSGGQSSWPS